MNNLKIILLMFIFLMGIPNTAYAEAMREPDDLVGFSFLIISMACLAATAFFFLERGNIGEGWKTSMTLAGIITGVTFIHSLFLRNLWITTGDCPIVYKYIEWVITMPLLMIQFYLILSAVRKTSHIIFWKLLVGTLIMVIGGYAGESGHILP